MTKTGENVIRLTKSHLATKINYSNLDKDTKIKLIDKLNQTQNNNQLAQVIKDINNMLSNANKGHLEQDLEKDDDFIPEM